MMFPLLTGGPGVVESGLEVMSAIAQWIVSMITSLFPIFYSDETGLTVIGFLSCCALGVSVTLLLVNKVSDFFHWRG